MKSIEIRQIFDDEAYQIMHRNNAYAFSSSPPLSAYEEWQEVLQGRTGVDYFALFEDGAGVANAATSIMTQNIRGKILPAGGVWGVVTRPESRRNGYCRQVMSKLFESEYQSGRAVSLLYPFRGSFYERLGYATFPQPRKAIFAPHSLASLMRSPLDGQVEIKPIAEGMDTYFEFLTNYRQKVHGFALFDHPDRARMEKQNNTWVATAISNNEIAGLMTYDLRGEGVMRFKLKSTRFYYKNSLGRYLLLQWIARHIDQANEIEIWLPPFEHPETWLADIRPDFGTVFFPPMGRVINIQQLEGIPTGKASLSVKVTDPLCPWNEGIWHFDGSNGTLAISRTRKADCELNINGLAALVYGTHHVADFAFLNWGNIPPEYHHAALTLFPQALPFIHEMF